MMGTVRARIRSTITKLKLVVARAARSKLATRPRPDKLKTKTLSPPPTLSPASSGPVAVGGLVYHPDKVVWADKDLVVTRFPPLTRPRMVPASKASHMWPEDTIVGLGWPARPRAYPWWILKNHHVVNDVVDRKPVMISFCENCSGAAAFSPVVDGRTHTFHLIGVYNGTNLIADFETGSVWAPYDGVCMDGRLRGAVIPQLPLVQTTWAQWRRRYPETVVTLAPEKLRGGHGSEQYIGRPGVSGDFRQSIGHWDERLPENELILGVTVSRAARGYPLRELEKVGAPVNDVLGGHPIVILADPTHYLAIAFSRALNGQVLEFTAALDGGDLAMAQDLASGSRWSLDGHALAGPCQGATLRFVPSYLTEWHAWASYHPDGQIFRGPH